MLERPKAHGSKVSFSLAFLILSSLVLTSIAPASEQPPYLPLTVELQTPASSFDYVAPFRISPTATSPEHPDYLRSTLEAGNDSREIIYSNLVGTDIWCISNYAKDPEVILGLHSEIVRYRSRKVLLQVDFAYFPARFPQEKGPGWLESLPDEESFQGNHLDLSEGDVALEDGLVGLSLFAHFPSPSGKFLPYLWLRSVHKPLLSSATSGVKVKYAASVQGGIPLQLGRHCSLRLEGGLILGLEEDTGELLHAHGATISLHRAF